MKTPGRSRCGLHAGRVVGRHRHHWRAGRAAPARPCKRRARRRDASPAPTISSRLAWRCSPYHDAAGEFPKGAYTDRPRTRRRGRARLGDEAASVPRSPERVQRPEEQRRRRITRATRGSRAFFALPTIAAFARFPAAPRSLPTFRCPSSMLAVRGAGRRPGHRRRTRCPFRLRHQRTTRPPAATATAACTCGPQEALNENPFACQVDYNGDGVAEWIPKDRYERIRIKDVDGRNEQHDRRRRSVVLPPH